MKKIIILLLLLPNVGRSQSKDIPIKEGFVYYRPSKYKRIFKIKVNKITKIDDSTFLVKGKKYKLLAKK